MIEFKFTKEANKLSSNIVYGGFLVSFVLFQDHKFEFSDLENWVYVGDNTYSVPSMLIPVWDHLKDPVNVNGNLVKQHNLYFYLPKTLTVNGPFGMVIWILQKVRVNDSYEIKVIPFIFAKNLPDLNYIERSEGIEYLSSNQGRLVTGWNSITLNFNKDISIYQYRQFSRLNPWCNSSLFKECIYKKSLLDQVLRNPTLEVSNGRGISKSVILSLINKPSSNDELEINSGQYNLMHRSKSDQDKFDKLTKYEKNKLFLYNQILVYKD